MLSIAIIKEFQFYRIIMGRKNTKIMYSQIITSTSYLRAAGAPSSSGDMSSTRYANPSQHHSYQAIQHFKYAESFAKV